MGGGRSMLNGPVEGAAESGDKEEDEEAMEDALGRPSTLSSVNRESRVPITSPYSSSSASRVGSAKSTMPGGAVLAHSRTSIASPSFSPNELTLLKLRTTRGGLKLRARPNTPLRALIDKGEPRGDDSNQSALNEAAWICDWPEDDVRLWVRKMLVFEGGASSGPLLLPGRGCSGVASAFPRLLSLAVRGRCRLARGEGSGVRRAGFDRGEVCKRSWCGGG